MPTVEEVIKKNRPNLSHSSVKSYNSLIYNLGKKIEAKIDQPSDIKTHFKKIVSVTKDLNPRQRKTLMAALVVLTVGDKDLDDTTERLRRIMMNDVEASKEEEGKLEMSEKQRENWMDMTEVMKKYQQLEREVKPLWTFDKLSESQFYRLQLYVLLTVIFGANLPPRRSQDYIKLKLKNFDQQEDNFYDSKRHVLVFNAFKTKKIYGQQTTTPDLRLRKILKDWTKFQTADNAFTWRGKEMTNSKLNDLLYDFFGKKVGLTMLRHIFITDKMKDVPMDLLETAKEMGHSVAEALTVYRKKV